MTTRIIFTHANCLDGAVAAWIWQRWVWPDAEIISCNYGDEPDWDRIDGDTHVVILDFSFDPDVWGRLCDQAGSVGLLDHHDTAIKKYMDYGVDMDRVTTAEGFLLGWEGQGVGVWMTNDHSGAALARLVALEINPIADIPDWVLNVDDRDRWQWKLEDTKEITAYLGALPHEPASYDAVMDQRYETIYAMGRAILQRDEQLVEEVVERAWLYCLDGNWIPMVDCAGSISSEVGHRLAVRSDHGWSATFRYVEIDDDLCLKWSLRSVEGGPHVGDIAQRLAPEGHKGGGHAGAAGYTMPADRLSMVSQ